MRDANHWSTLVEIIEDSMQIDEYDYYSTERDADMKAYHCPHKDSEYVHEVNDAVLGYSPPIGWHCNDCGAAMGAG